MSMKTVQKAKVVSNFTIPDVGPVRLDGYDVIVDSGEIFWCATHRQAKELIAQRGFVEVSDFDAPGAPKRYFTATGDIDWEFVSSATVGLKRDLSISEREIRQAHYLSGRLGVIRWLVRRGEIDHDQVQACENAQTLARHYSAYLANRRRRHGNWARGRKSVSY